MSYEYKIDNKTLIQERTIRMKKKGGGYKIHLLYTLKGRLNFL